MDTEQISEEIVSIRQRLREVSELSSDEADLDEEASLRQRLAELQDLLSISGAVAADAESAHTEADRMHYLPPA